MNLRNTSIMMFLCSLLVALPLVAQGVSPLRVTVTPERGAVLGFQSLFVRVEFVNDNLTPSPALSRELLFSKECIVCAPLAAAGEERRGEWATILSPLPEGPLGLLLPGEKYSARLEIALPKALATPRALLGLQWVGRSDWLQGIRSDESRISVLEGKSPVAVVDTSKGSFLLELWPEHAPNHVANFITLANKGFFDGLLVHRVVPGFVIQTGCPLGNGAGDPGYALKAEFNGIEFKKGVLGMARGAGDDTAGCQWFVCLGETASLNGHYTAFGKVIDGQNAVDEIGRVRRDNKDQPMSDVTVRSVKVFTPKTYELPAVQTIPIK